MPVTFDQAWEQALTTLELDVDLAESLLRSDHLPSTSQVEAMSAFVPSADLGPLPAPLMDRARALSRRQHAVAEALTRAMLVNRRHLATLEATRPHPPASPVFVDVTG